MSDLAEHIGTVISIVSALLAVVGILVTVIWKDLRKAIGEAKTEAKAGSKQFMSWLGEQLKYGGLITREDHFTFCGQERQKCPIAGLVEWRNELYNTGGGPLLMKEHTILCKEVVSHILDGFYKEEEHSRSLMMTELKLIQATLKNEVLDEIRKLKISGCGEKV